MLMQLVENIEQDLKNTTKIKDKLNVICDVSWNLVCPPGIGKGGKFIVEKPTTNSESQRDSEGCSSSSQNLYKDVTDLINYGKLVRSSKNVEDVKGTVTDPRKSGGGEKSTSNKITHLEKTPTRSKCLSLKTGRSSSLDVKMSRHCNISRDDYTERNGGNRNVDIQGSAHNMTPGVKYSHTCSLTLSGQFISLKLSEDLNHLLKQYNLYINQKTNVVQKKNEKHQDFEHIFSSKFKKHVKSKLQNDLQNTNQYEKQMEYVDVIEKAAENKMELPRLQTVLQYRSKEQLELFEARSHRLLELQLQSKLLNIIVAYLSDPHDGVLE